MFSFGVIRRTLIYSFLSFSLFVGCKDTASHPAVEQASADGGVAPAQPPGADPIAAPPPGASSPPAVIPPPVSVGQEPPGVQAPRLRLTLGGIGSDEGWLSSPAVADLDQDGRPEIIAARGRTLYVWHSDGSLFWKGVASTTGRIWGPPVVADLD